MNARGPWDESSLARHRTVSRLQQTKRRFAVRPSRCLPADPVQWPRLVEKEYPTAVAEVVRKIGRAVGFVCERCGLGASHVAFVCVCRQAHFKCHDCSFKPCGNGGGWRRIGVPVCPPRRIEIMVDPTTQPLETMWTLVYEGSTPHLNVLPVVRHTPRLKVRAERLDCPAGSYDRLLGTAVLEDARDYLALLHVGARSHPRAIKVSEADRKAALLFACVRRMSGVTVPPTETLGMMMMDAETGAVGVTVVKVDGESSAASAKVVAGTVLTAVDDESLLGLSSVEASAAIFKAAASSTTGTIVLWVYPCTQHHRAARIEPRVPPSASNLVEASALSLLQRGREVAGNRLCVVLVACPALVEPIRRKITSDPRLTQFEQFGCPQLRITQYSGTTPDAAELVRLVELDLTLTTEPIFLSLANAACIVITYLPKQLAPVVRDALTSYLNQ